MKGVGGDFGMKAKSWWSDCVMVSPLMMPSGASSHSSSFFSSSRRGGKSLLKVATCLAMVVLLVSLYQSCAPEESSLPVWLSLSFVSRPSFIVSTPELSQLPQERPASRLVETLAPIPLDFSVASGQVEEEDAKQSEVRDGDENPERRDTFETHNGSLSGLVRTSDSSNSGTSDPGESVGQDPSENTLHGSDTSEPGSSFVEQNDSKQVSNFSDSASASVENGEIKEIDTLVPPEATSMEEGNSNSTDTSSLSSVVNEVPKDELKDGKITVPSELSSMEGVNSNSSGSNPPASSFKDEINESEATVIIEPTSKIDESNDGNISGDGGEEKEQLEVVLSNWPPEPKPETDAAISSDEVVLQRDAVSDFASAPAVTAPFSEQELAQAAFTQTSVDSQLAAPSSITEKPMDERRIELEQQLSAAKQAIEEATVADSDPSLYHVIYHNVSAFSKSYKLMEEMFKIYVYKEGKPPLVHTGPLLGIYASEGRFINRINRGSSFVVDDPELAHMFYLPYSVTEMTLTIYVEGSHSMKPLNTFIKEYVDQVAAKYPFWNRTRGADHFFLSCHDWGPATARDHAELRNNSMKVVCNADLNEEYVPGKDASLPEIYLHNYKPVKVGGPGAIRRSFLAFFAGQMHGHVRPMLIEHWKDKDPDMKIYEVLPKAVERKWNYVDHMKNSKYCICAAGFEVNSPRIVEAIYYDCVPVIIADNFVLPFSDVLNWNTFSVTIPESEIPNLKSILLSISDRQHRAMQKRLSKVRQHFLWHDEPVKYDVFHMIMHSVWLSRLNRIHL